MIDCHIDWIPSSNDEARFEEAHRRAEELWGPGDRHVCLFSDPDAYDIEASFSDNRRFPLRFLHDRAYE